MAVYEQYAACIQQCNLCAVMCDFCFAACLDEADPKPMARCISLDADCAQACRVAAAYLARGSEGVQAACEFCAGRCETCGEECVKHAAMHAHCRDCAEACFRCAEECRRVAQVLSGVSATSL